MTGSIEQEVRWLDIAMDKCRFECMLQSCGGLAGVVDGASDAQRSPRLHEVLEAHAVDEFHHEKMGAAIAVDVVCANNVHVVEPRDGLSFANKTLKSSGRLVFLGRQDFEGNAAYHVAMFTKEHRAHSTGSEMIENFVFAAEKEVVPLSGKEQLGLKVVPMKAPMEVLFIDRAEQPTPN